MNNFRIILRLCVAFAHFACTIALDESCVNPLGDEGVCKSIQQCESMSHIINKTRKTKEEHQFMIDAICEYEGENPKVCCSYKVPIITRECSTPDGAKGQCIDVYNCTMAVTVLTTPDAEDRAMIKRLKCTGPGDAYYVCCPYTPVTDPLSVVTVVPSTTASAPSPSREIPPESPPPFTYPEQCLSTELPPDPESGCCGMQFNGDNRIFGGSGTGIYKYPWLALIEYRRHGHSELVGECGGSLISGRHVLTAAHCVDPSVLRDRNIESVRLGDYDISNDGVDCEELAAGQIDCNDKPERVRVGGVYPHLAFRNERLRKDDIALIRLERMVKFTSFIAPICLPTVDVDVNPPTTDFWVAGWGAVSNKTSTSDLKQHVTVPFVKHDICKTENFRGLGDGQICAGGEVGKDSCKGDSGGPLMYRQSGDRYEVTGVVSAGTLVCAGHSPALYTHVFKYLHWIRNTIQNASAIVSPCLTPDGQNGDCESVTRCPTLRSIVNKANRTHAEVQLLQKSRCSFDGIFPKVCCPPEPVPEVQESNTCYTPEGHPGDCMSIYECKHISDWLGSSPNVSEADRDYVYRIRCPSSKGSNTFNVCCGPPPVSVSIPDRADIVPTLECTASVAPPDPRTKCCGLDGIGSNKISGGTAAGIDQYPWLALIEYKSGNKIKLLCGGVLISGRCVLTAGHCVAGVLKESGAPTNVRLGEYDTANNGSDCVQMEGGGPDDLDCTEEPITIPIEAIIPHPEYDPRSQLKRHDIALLRLATMAPYTYFVRPICLPTADVTVDMPASGKLFAAGWGAISDRITSSNKKLHVILPYMNLDVCQKAYAIPNRRVKLWERQVCAGGEVGKDVCKGDSGGPLMYSTGISYEVIGIVSFGPTQCDPDGSPSVYTKVFEYLPWIRSNIRP